MNAVKIALLGTAALAAVSVSAQASEKSDLIAQMEALNSRIAALESSASVPAGYQLLSVSTTDAIIIPGLDSVYDKGFSKKAHNIGIMPSADVPASTNIQWQGSVRAGLVYKTGKTTTTTDTTVLIPAVVGVADNPATPADETVKAVAAVPVGVVSSTARMKSLDVRSRARLKVTATTDTAVGEVGVKIGFAADSAGSGKNNRGNSVVSTDGYWGWWRITPELTLGGGVDGTLADSSNTFDNRCSCNYIDTGGAFGHDGDPSQIRLSYASGPISFALAVEDHVNTGTKSTLGFAGEMKYSGDTIGFDISSGYWGGSNSTQDADWNVNAGANMALGDIANLGLAVGAGEEGHVVGNSDKYMKASVFMGFTLSDSLGAELGATYTDGKGKRDTMTVGGGLYYSPVSQLTLGLEASYANSTSISKVGPPQTISSKSNATVVAVSGNWKF